jgi:hypothetical protein
MMYLLKNDVQFKELDDAMEQFESTKGLTIESYKSFMTDTCPKLIIKYSTIYTDVNPVDSNEISKDNKSILYNTSTLFRKIIAFTERSEQILISLLTSKSMLLERDYVDSLRKYLKIELSSPREAIDLAEYLVNNKDNPKSAASGKMFLAEYSNSLLVGFHNDFLVSLEKILENISDQNINELSGENTRRISNLSPTQLGLLSSLLSSANDIKLGFRNLKKTEIDDMFSKFLTFKDRPVKAKALSSKGYFGKDTEDSDIDALESYLNRLLKVLRDEIRKNR